MPAELRRPRRILIAGVSGAGKTTLASRIAAKTGIEHTEIDGLHHGPAWTPRPQFQDDVRTLAAGDTWVTEWQYRVARPLLLERAELLVWLDLPTPLVMRRIVGRTVRRGLLRTELWNGNFEPPLRRFFTDREHIVRWAWRTRHEYRDLDARLAAIAPQLVVVRLRSSREVAAWLATFPDMR